MATGTNGIATNADLKALYPNITIVGDEDQCPVKAEIVQSYGITVLSSSSYSQNQLVKYDHIDKITRYTDRLYLGFKVTVSSSIPAGYTNVGIDVRITLQKFTSTSATTPLGTLATIDYKFTLPRVSGYSDYYEVIGLDDSYYYGNMASGQWSVPNNTTYGYNSYSTSRTITKGTFGKTIKSPGDLWSNDYTNWYDAPNKILMPITLS